VAAALDQAGLALPGDASAEAIASLAEGSVGAAVQLVEQDGVALYRDLVQLASTLPGMDRSTALKLSDAAGARGAETRFDLTLALLDRLLARLARTGATGQTPAAHRAGEDAVLSRLSPDPHTARAWAELAADLTGRARRGRAVNLDPAALIFDMFLDLDRTAERLAVPAA
jgi:DNA polymerase-3 subunit delta'